MGQAEVIEILEEKRESWLTAQEIAEIQGQTDNVNRVRRALKVLWRYNEILRKRISKEAGHLTYVYMAK